MKQIPELSDIDELIAAVQVRRCPDPDAKAGIVTYLNAMRSSALRDADKLTAWADIAVVLDEAKQEIETWTFTEEPHA